MYDEGSSRPCPLLLRSRRALPLAHGDATGHIFLVSAGIAVVGVFASLFLTPTKLRDSVDL